MFQRFANCFVLERSNGCVSLCAQFLHLSFCIFYASILLGKSNKCFDFRTVCLAFLYFIGQSKHRGIIRRIKRVDNRQRQFTFRHIAASRLTYLGIAVIIEDIITYLEANTHDFTEAARLFYKVFAGICRQGSEFGARCKKRGGFMVYDTEICLLGNLFRADICDLENLAF